MLSLATYSELLEVLNAQIVAEEVQQSVLQHAAMTVAICHSCQLQTRRAETKKVQEKRQNSRENETIPVQPLGVLGVELHELVEEDVGNRCHAPGN
jgi:hypothetical protein